MPVPMKVAVLPFNAVEGTQPAFGRQFSNFVGETIRAATQADINPVSFLAQIDDTDGPRAAFVNIADTLLDAQWLQQMFEQSQVDIIMDGLVERNETGFDLTVRFHRSGQEQPSRVLDLKFADSDLFDTLHGIVKELAGEAEIDLPEGLAGDSLDFGTDNAKAFLLFLEGYDAVTYIQQANGRVAKEFDPNVAMQNLTEALDLDPDFVAPYEMLVQLCRMCAQHRIGTFEAARDALLKLTEMVPDDYKAFFALGEVFQQVNDPTSAANYYEKAIKVEPNEAALYTRLGVAQMAQGMPVNAERNFRKAIEMEGDDKPSMDFLVGVLQQTNRAHEVPGLWKQVMDANPQNAQAHAKYALSLMQTQREDDAIKAFESALETLEDPIVVKRYYAPILAEKQDFDRAMDFYEDVIEVAPNEVPVLLEYAQTLQSAGREFEVPRILRDVLNNQPDPNTRAQTLAWLIELEQPKRAEAVESANNKLNDGKPDEALSELRPLKNWLADYWKLWLIVAGAANRVGEAEEAEDAAKRLLDIFPGCEPGYAELASSLNQQEKHEEAYNVMRYAAQQLPQSLPVHVNLALAAKRAGHRDEAVSLVRQLREAIGPNEELEGVFRDIEEN